MKDRTNRGATDNPSSKDRGVAGREKKTANRGFTHDRFSAIKADLLDRMANPTALHRELIERMVVNLRLAERYQAEAEANPFVKGSRGQLVEHPGFRIAARCDSHAASIVRQLEPLITRQDHGQGEEVHNVIALARAQKKGAHKR